jgi:hypothetical protein
MRGTEPNTVGATSRSSGSTAPMLEAYAVAEPTAMRP